MESDYDAISLHKRQILQVLVDNLIIYILTLQNKKKKGVMKGVREVFGVNGQNYIRKTLQRCEKVN